MPEHSENPKRKRGSIRGVDSATYAKLRHQVESGQIDEATLVSRGLLRPGKGLALQLDDNVFTRRSKVRGRAGHSELCLVPSCERKQSRRGLCNTHRVYAARMIRLGKASEQNLINRDLILPKGESTPKTVVAKNPKPGLRRKLFCLYPKCKDTATRRGLCKRHYNQYRRRRQALPENQRIALDKDLIKRKLLLDQSLQKKDDPFALGSRVRGSLKKY